MLDAARTALPTASFEQGDAATWEPPRPPDVLFSNATLHWVRDHATLFPRLASQLAPGGWLAVQMPANFDAPSHSLLRDIASQPGFEPAAAALLHDVVQPAAWYLDTLSALLDDLDVWETTYHQVLDGGDPVLSWTRGSALRPALDALEPEAADEFEAAYAEALRAAYPQRRDGRTVLPFRRLFLVGHRDSGVLP
jgi:trans-aconitate 2-methyltransferase